MEVPVDKIKFALVGCGRISDLHARAYEQSPDAEIFAVCDANPDRAAQRKDQWGARKAYTDYEKLLKDPDIQAVELLVPHHLHRDMAVAAAQARKHVSVQKPMANTVSEARSMIAAAKENGVLLKVFENFVFYPPYLRARQLVAEGAIGTLITVRMRLTTAGKGGWVVPGEAWTWRFDPKLGGGGPVVFDDGYHKFSQAYDIGGEVEKVYAWIDHTFTVVDAPAFIMWKYREGQRARYGAYDMTFCPEMFMNSDYYTSDDRMELVGTEGIIFVNRCTGKLLQEPSLVLYRDGETRCFHSLRDDWADSFIDSGRHFFSCIKSGGDPILSGQTGLSVLQFALAPEISAREGREVDPAEINS
jgi:predicted dehydrogenase